MCIMEVASRRVLTSTSTYSCTIGLWLCLHHGTSPSLSSGSRRRWCWSVSSHWIKPGSCDSSTEPRPLRFSLGTRLQKFWSASIRISSFFCCSSRHLLHSAYHNGEFARRGKAWLIAREINLNAGLHTFSRMYLPLWLSLILPCTASEQERDHLLSHVLPSLHSGTVVMQPFSSKKSPPLSVRNPRAYNVIIVYTNTSW